MENLTTQLRESERLSTQRFVQGEKAIDKALEFRSTLTQQMDNSQANALAKSQEAAERGLASLTSQFEATTTSLRNQIDDLKASVGKMEALKQGGRENVNNLYAFAGFFLTALTIATTLVIIFSS